MSNSTFPEVSKVVYLHCLKSQGLLFTYEEFDVLLIPLFVCLYYICILVVSIVKNPTVF